MRTVWFLHKNRKNINSVHFGAFGLTPSPMYENPGKYGISIDKWGRWRSGRFWDSPRIIKMKRALLAIVLFFIIEETHSPVMKEQRMLAKLKKFYLNLSASAFRRTGKGGRPASGRPWTRPTQNPYHNKKVLNANIKTERIPPLNEKYIYTKKITFEHLTLYISQWPINPIHEGVSLVGG